MAMNFSSIFKSGAWKRSRGFQAHINAGAGPEYGVDYACATGTPIVSTHTGKVSQVSRGTSGFGNMVRIRLRRGDGKLGNWYIAYAHLSKISCKLDQLMSAGELVGLAGQSGWATGPHLHFSVTYRNSAGSLVPKNPEDKKIVNWTGNRPPPFPY